MTSPLQRDLNYRLTANTGNFERGMGEAEKAARAFERELAREEARQAKVDQAMTDLGTTMLTAGAAIGVGLGLATKAAVDWESSWAGVLKTVDGTDEQMAALEEEIRGLTAVLPASHKEIAAVAEAAGQLGIQRQDIADFTRTMIDMGEATNLSSDEAATAIAQFMNIMQTAPQHVNRLASSIVDLGNKGATTEAEITEMALRIAGAGRTIGLSEQQVLGFGAALSNVGIRAEAGGTAISKVFLEIDSAVSEGGDNLTTFARAAGMSADEFARAYRDDAGAAIASFVTGLGRVHESGGDVNQILSDLGLTEARVSDALRRLAGSGDNLTKSLRISADAWDENTALLQEAERRYGTVEARMAIARNQVNDFAIDIGQTFLPVVGEMADKVGTLANLFGDLPGPLRTAVGVLAAVSAGILVTSGAALIAVPKLAAFSAALDQVQNSGGRAATAVGVFRRAGSGVVGLLGGPWGAALAIGVTALTAYAVSQANARAKVEELSQTLDDQTGAVTDNTRLWIANELANRKATGVFTLGSRQTDEFVDNLDKANISMNLAVDAALGQAEALEFLNQKLAEAKQREDDLSGGITLSTSERGKAKDEATGQRRAIEDIIEVVQDEGDKVKAATELQKLLNDGRGDTADTTRQLSSEEQQLAEMFDLSADSATDLAAEIDALDKALDALLTGLFGVEEAEDAAAHAMRRLVDETKEAAEAGNKHAKSLEGNSAAALANRENVRSLIAADFELVSAMAQAGATSDELQDKTRELRRRFVEQMLQLGFTEEQVLEYAEAYDQVPGMVSTTITTPGMTEAEKRLRNLKANIDAIPRRVGVTVTATVDSQRIAGLQHGGEVSGSRTAPPDSELIAATPGEIVIRREVSQRHRSALLALNETGHIPLALAPRAGGGGAGSQSGNAIGGLTQIIENVNVTPIGDRWSTKQIMDELALHGAT